MEELGIRIIYMNRILKLNSYFAVYKASSAEAEYFNGTISYDINIKTSGNFLIKSMKINSNVNRDFSLPTTLQWQW